MTRRVFDLSQTISTGMQVFPLHSPTHVIPWARLETYGFESEAIFCNSHAGTHVDAPSHFLADGPSVDQIPLERFFGPAVVFDLSDAAPGGMIDAASLARCEALQIAITPGDTVLLWTGIDASLGQPEYLSRFPGLSEGGARYLVDREVNAVGIDGPGIDHSSQRTCPVHHLLLPREILIYENLARLGDLLRVARGRRFVFHALPLRIEGATGSPVRAMAVVD